MSLLKYPSFQRVLHVHVYVQASGPDSVELGCVPIREVSSFQRVLCTVFSGVGMCPY